MLNGDVKTILKMPLWEQWTVVDCFYQKMAPRGKLLLPDSEHICFLNPGTSDTIWGQRWNRHSCNKAPSAHIHLICFHLSKGGTSWPAFWSPSFLSYYSFWCLFPLDVFWVRNECLFLQTIFIDWCILCWGWKILLCSLNQYLGTE